MSEKISTVRSGVVAFLLTLALWLVFAWPLPQHLFSTIPSGLVKPAGHTTVEPMEPGDHLQLDYHFWLFSEFVAGTTPWFHNLYEFNVGDDEARYEPGSFYVPFSLFYTVGSWIGGRAFGWNFTGFLSLWMTAWFTFLLARRYTATDAPAWLAAAVSVMFPYRWIALLGGSPTGFSMAWVPLLFLGLDRAVRDDKTSGGVMAGLAVLFAAWGDTHTFFFGVLAAPCWCLFAFMHRAAFPWRNVRAWLRLAVALTPVAAFTVLALLLSPTSSRIINEAGSGARTIREILLFSPRPEGLWSWSSTGVSDQIYIGVALCVLVAASLGCFVAQRRYLAGWALLVTGMLVTTLLAMGPAGPGEGRLFAAVRDLIGPYSMIRQPAKIFCLMPTLAAMALVLGATSCPRPRVFALAASVLLLAEWRAGMQTVLNRYETEQAAYEAVAKTATRPPRALVVPLWPGDSHQTSVYQHYVSLYRIRMVNGYRPFVAKEYVDTVFHGFESANMGSLSDAQLDDLLDRGVDFIVLHEDIFPEKVSPFPSGYTRIQFLFHPRLEMLWQDGPVTSFRILSAAREVDSAPCATWFPTRRIEWEAARGDGARHKEATASDGGYISLTEGRYAGVRKNIHAPWTPNLRWTFRARGDGKVAVTIMDATTILDVRAADWTWFDVPLDAPFQGVLTVSPGVTATEGTVELDQALLVGGAWQSPATGESIVMPAATFFHGGRADDASGAVRFTRGRDADGLAFYGPRLPVEPGRYRMRFETPSEAPPYTILGTVVIRHEGGGTLRTTRLLAQGDNAPVFDVPANLPLLCEFHYANITDVEIRSVRIERLPEP
jgi:hypothetical protein